MTDAKLAAAGRLTIRIAQILLVASAVGLWAARDWPGSTCAPSTG